jgi:peptidyl-prolyl cis-trans isomerase SurA
MHAYTRVLATLARTAAWLAFFLAAAAGTFAQTPPEPGAPVVLDRVVAVVNNHAILASDVAKELRLSVLEPEGPNGSKPNAREALDQLVSRALIRQQIREQDMQAAEPNEELIRTRMAELRKNLPACMHANCRSDAGWAAFLASHELTERDVRNYVRLKLEILTFIEDRFQQGVHITQEEIEAYYRTTLLPQYRKGEPAPPLDAVAPRISEILLQQQVNVLFDSWLDSLRKQGDVEILDPALNTNPYTATGKGSGA